MVQRKELNFEGQNIYIGIDVHLKTWHVSILTESGCLKKHSQQSSAQALFEHLKKHYPNGNYLSAYEAGFSGFSTYYSLLVFTTGVIVSKTSFTACKNSGSFAFFNSVFLSTFSMY